MALRMSSTLQIHCMCKSNILWCLDYYRYDSLIHSDVFNWLWPRLLQDRLDLFREYWNNHYLRPQKDKMLPSGTSPRQIWEAPESVSPTARNCSVKVRPELVSQLRDSIGGVDGRHHAYAFVTQEFKAVADNAYYNIGCPAIDLTNAWNVFTRIVDVLRG